jgi:hypothetical protein
MDSHRSNVFVSRFIAIRFAARAALARYALIALAFAAGVAAAAPIPVPNGDFSDPANFGTVGGGLIGGSGTDVPIGSGPWLGTYAGVLGLLAPPTLTITDGAATIDGLAAANVLGILNNGGSFGQTLAATFEAGKRYTIASDVDAGTPLDIGLLANGNFGLALTSGGATLASTATAPPQLVDLQPIGGTVYRMTLQFDPTVSQNGTVGLQLFAEPQQLIGASLFPNVTFGNVTLDATAIDPVSGTIVPVDPTPQSATVGEPFANALEVLVTDVNGDPVPDVTVTFAAPASGASAVLSSDTATTDATGRASVTATANTVAGSYVVNASVEGVDTPASFNLTNTAGAAAATIAALGAAQSAVVGMPFPEPLVVLVTDVFGNPVEGVEVDFAAPTTGATAILSATTVFTDANGLAQVTATANNITGSYEITATVSGIAPPAAFALTNRLDDGTTVTGGSGDEQSASLGGAFACALTVAVADANSAPLAGVAVDFAAPDTGASATLSNGVVSGTTVRAITDAEGNAIVNATANDVPGDYVVTATLVDSSAASVEFGLSNLGDYLFGNGFDTPCRSPLP